jgi:hypothetical protein
MKVSLMHGFQPNRGPLPELTWRKTDGHMRYDFTDADDRRCSLLELDTRMVAGKFREEPVICFGLNKLNPEDAVHHMLLTKDMAYWLSQALLTFSNTGKLP